jgi:hypothetical protein
MSCSGLTVSYTPEDEILVRGFAATRNLPVSTGRVKSLEFHELMLNEWKPDLCNGIEKHHLAADGWVSFGKQ